MKASGSVSDYGTDEDDDEVDGQFIATYDDEPFVEDKAAEYCFGVQESSTIKNSKKQKFIWSEPVNVLSLNLYSSEKEAAVAARKMFKNGIPPFNTFDHKSETLSKINM